MRRLFTPFPAAALAAATRPALPGGASAMSASAMPGAPALPLAGDAPSIILASGGCGPYRHRGFNGFCYGGGGFYRPYGVYRPYGYRPAYGYRRFGYY